MRNLYVKYKEFIEENYYEEDKEREYQISVNYTCAMKINTTSCKKVIQHHV